MRDEDSRFTEEGSILLLESIYSHFGGRCSYFDEDNVIFVSSSSLSISYIIASAAILYCNKKKKDESEICHLLLAIEHLTRGEIPDYLIRHKKQALSILANIPSLKDNSAFFREATLFILKKVVS
jgi:hypothetical protein